MMNTKPLIGKCGKKILKHTSPFATLLLDLSSELTADEVSQFKLALTVDQHVTKRKRVELKNAAEILLHLHESEMIKPTDTMFLEHLLAKLHRMDLVNKIGKYHKKHSKKENEQTLVKVPYTKETSIKPASTSIADFTALKELKVSPSPNTSTRSFGDGCSLTGIKHNKKAGDQDSLEFSPMVIDENSQEHKLSQMSISDEEKEKLGHKMAALFDDDVVLHSQ